MAGGRGEGAVSAAKAAILARVRDAQRTARLPAQSADRLTPRTPTPAEMLSRFREELTALGVENFLEESPEAVCARVAAFTAGKRLLAWDPELLPYGAGALVAAACHGASARDEQARAEVGVTGCEAAIAETGSLVLLSGKGRSRAISLLPALHLAVVRRQDVVFGMGDFFASNAARLDASSCCTFVTGPSRTADIELTLTLGVHGPGKLVVVIGP